MAPPPLVFTLAALSAAVASALFVPAPHDPIASTLGLISRVLGPQYVAADSTIAIDCQTDCHYVLLVMAATMIGKGAAARIADKPV